VTGRLGYTAGRGLKQFSAHYERPLGSAGTQLGLRYVSSASEVIERPFNRLGIESRSATLGLDLRQPLVRREGLGLDLFASLEHRRSKSFLLGSGFSFAEGSEDGSVELAVVQFGQELTLRWPDRVLAVRSVLRWGVDALGATARSDVDGQFLSWLGQLQWAQRLSNRGASLLLRGNLQLSTDALPGLEQFAVGGHSSVRGYRENRIVRDNGWFASLELHLPLWTRPNAEPLLELRPFVDVGYSWNRRQRPTPALRTLSSAGVGLVLRASSRVQAELYYAHSLRDLPDAARDLDLQNRGLHLRITSVFR